MGKEAAALGLTLLVHLVAFGVLLWAILDGEGADWRSWWPRDEGPPDDPLVPPPTPGGGDGLPLPDAQPAPGRLRTEHDRLPSPPRRRTRQPAHAPERAPGRTPAGS